MGEELLESARQAEGRKLSIRLILIERSESLCSAHPPCFSTNRIVVINGREAISISRIFQIKLRLFLTERQIMTGVILGRNNQSIKARLRQVQALLKVRISRKF